MGRTACCSVPLGQTTDAHKPQATTTEMTLPKHALVASLIAALLALTCATWKEEQTKLAPVAAQATGPELATNETLLALASLTKGDNDGDAAAASMTLEDHCKDICSIGNSNSCIDSCTTRAHACESDDQDACERELLSFARDSGCIECARCMTGVDQEGGDGTASGT